MRIFTKISTYNIISACPGCGGLRFIVVRHFNNKLVLSDHKRLKLPSFVSIKLDRSFSTACEVELLIR